MFRKIPDEPLFSCPQDQASLKAFLKPLRLRFLNSFTEAFGGIPSTHRGGPLD